jgi:hypothetical protein
MVGAGMQEVVHAIDKHLSVMGEMVLHGTGWRQNQTSGFYGNNDTRG